MATFWKSDTRPTPDQMYGQVDTQYNDSLANTRNAISNFYRQQAGNAGFAPGSVNPYRVQEGQALQKAMSADAAARAGKKTDLYSNYAMNMPLESSGFSNLVGPLAGSFAQAAGGKLAGAAGDMLSKAGGWAWDAGKTGFSNLFGGGAPIANQGYGASAMEDALANTDWSGFANMFNPTSFAESFDPSQLSDVLSSGFIGF